MARDDDNTDDLAKQWPGGKLHKVIKLSHRYNRLQAFIRLLDGRNLFRLYALSPSAIADHVAFRNFAKREQLYVKAQIDIVEVNDQIRALRKFNDSVSVPSSPEDLSFRKAELQWEIKHWECYAFWEWFKAISEIWEQSEFRKKHEASELARETNEFLKDAPRHKSRPKNPERDRKIYEISRAAKSLDEYCHIMTARGIKPLWPGVVTYNDAYKKPKLRELISKERDRINRRIVRKAALQ